jgi:uncharacterized protein YkwD
MARTYPTLLVVALFSSACAINPMTPTPVATLTQPPAVARLKVEPTLGPASPTEAPVTATPEATAVVEPTEVTPIVAGVILVVTETPVVVVQQSVPATAAPSLPVADVPPAPTAVPPVQVAPPPSADVAAAEQYCIDLINVQRANAGLAPLARDETVMGIARARVADMVARGYTGHNDPVTGVSLGPAMLSAAGFGRAGENWYGSVNGPPVIVDVAMGWFMTDPPHYRNILSTGYAYVGVGIAYNGRQWLLIQNFAGN